MGAAFTFMTLAQFRTEVLKLCAQRGQAYVTASADVDTRINEVLRDYSRRTRCLFSDRLTFVPVANTAAYRFDTGTSAFGNVAIVDILRVYMTQGGSLSPLRDMEGRQGMTHLSDLQDRKPGYLSEPSGTTLHAFKTVPATLTLWPAPAVVTGSHYVSGFYYHPSVTVDADNIVLPDEHERSALEYLAALLLLPNAVGDSKEAVTAYLQLAREGMDAAGLEALNMMQGNVTRQPQGPSVFSLTDGF